MDAILFEWGSLLVRWLHIIAGMAWIGSSFYFMHIDASIKPTSEIPPGKGGESWEVHGGGFYNVRKWLVAPDKLPPQLIWNKWEAYTTWVSGFALLVWVYYFAADLYLIDPAVRQLSPWAAAGTTCRLATGAWRQPFTPMVSAMPCSPPRAARCCPTTTPCCAPVQAPPRAG